MKIEVIEALKRARFRGLALLLSVFAVLSVSPVSAHAPSGAGGASDVELPVITIQASDGTIVETTLDDAVALHGHLCICVAGAYRALGSGIEGLYESDEVPCQGELEVLYCHPGKGYKQIFEGVLGPECVTYEKVGDSQHLTPDNFSYTFTRRDTGEVLEMCAYSEVVSEQFVEMRYAVGGFDKGWHEDEPSDAEVSAYADVWAGVLNEFLERPSWELFEGVEPPDDEAPTGALIFSGALVAMLGVGLVISAWSSKRRRN